MRGGGVVIEARPYAPPAPTRRSCEAAALLGLSFDDLHEAEAPRRVEVAMATRTVTLITGPSGAGKSTLLRESVRRAKVDGWRVIDAATLRLGDAPAVNVAGRDVESALSRLASVGLAEARCIVRRAREMSDGQRARLRLAAALERASRRKRAVRTLIVVDEFAQALDRATARSVAMSFARAVKREANVGAIVATSHDDLESALAPAEVVRVSLTGEVRIERCEGERRAADRYDIEAGTLADYDALAGLHYRSGRPASIVKTIRAADALTGEIAGVLVVAMPTLNGAWRRLAWPGRYETGNKRVDARRLNDEVRRIARVVVDPRHRGVGLASRLVRAYLDEPLTARTEAVAAMARFSRFFERAGMRAIDVPTLPRDARLLDALEHAGVELFRLATPASAWRRAVDATSEEFMDRELRQWSYDRGAETARYRERREELWRKACRTVAAGRRVYVHG